MTIEKVIIESITEKNHPREFTVPERVLKTVFEFDDIPVKKIPDLILKFKDQWIFGPGQEKTIYQDVKIIYNQGIVDCINEINKAYKFMPGAGGSAEYLQNLLKKVMIKCD